MRLIDSEFAKAKPDADGYRYLTVESLACKAYNTERPTPWQKTSIWRSARAAGCTPHEGWLIR